MSEPTKLAVQAGVPYNRVVRITGGKSVWPALADFEVRSQIRAGRYEGTALRYDLTPHLTAALDGNDITIALSMTGQETRSLVGGYYDMFVSDVGGTDTRALRVLHGQVVVEPATTSAADA